MPEDDGLLNVRNDAVSKRPERLSFLVPLVRQVLLDRGSHVPRPENLSWPSFAIHRGGSRRSQSKQEINERNEIIGLTGDFSKAVCPDGNVIITAAMESIVRICYKYSNGL